MTLDQSALLEMLDALKIAQIDDRVRQAAETIYQALIEAELTAVIGAARRTSVLGGQPVPRMQWGRATTSSAPRETTTPAGRTTLVAAAMVPPSQTAGMPRYDVSIRSVVLGRRSTCAAVSQMTS